MYLKTVQRVFTVLAGLGLFLLLGSQVGAESLIGGWDRVRFGMSPDEVRAAYYVHEAYAGKGHFWKEREEDYRQGTRHELRTGLWVLGYKASVTFSFVDALLFEVEVYTSIYTDSPIPGLSQAVEAQLSTIPDISEEEKAGCLHPSHLDIMGEYKTLYKFSAQCLYGFADVIRHSVLEYFEEKYGIFREQEENDWGTWFIWEDPNGNILKLFLGKYGRESINFRAVYTDGSLLAIWEEKRIKWEKKRQEYKGIGVDSF